MKHTRSHRTQALWNLGWVLLALLILWLQLGAPYFSRQQADAYVMRKSLAQHMTVMETIPVPEDSTYRTADAQETISILRYGDTISVMRTANGNGFSYVSQYPNRDGMVILPLYGIQEVDHLFTGVAVAVVPTNPDIVAVDVVYCKDGNTPPVTFQTQEVYNGVFMVDCTDVDRHIAITVHDQTLAWNYVGAIGYDDQGKVIAQTKSVWEENYETR